MNHHARRITPLLARLLLVGTAVAASTALAAGDTPREPFQALETPLPPAAATAPAQPPMPPAPPVAPAAAAPTPGDFPSQITASLQQWAASLPAKAPGVRLDTTWQAVDPRLALPACPHPPAVTPTGNRLLGRSAVRISCDTPPWRLMVSVTVRGFQKVVVSQAPLERGQMLQASLLALEEREINDSNGGQFTSIASLEGYTAKRTLPRGQVLTRTMLEAPMLVRKGQSVILEAGSDTFTVRTEGTALTDGAAGDMIRVRNSQSGRTVEGTVTGEGRVRVAF